MRAGSPLCTIFDFWNMSFNFYLSIFQRAVVRVRSEILSVG